MIKNLTFIDDDDKIVLFEEGMDVSRTEIFPPNEPFEYYFGIIGDMLKMAPNLVDSIEMRKNKLRKWMLDEIIDTVFKSKTSYNGFGKVVLSEFAGLEKPL